MTKCSQCGGKAWTYFGFQRPYKCPSCGYVYCYNCAKKDKFKCPRCGSKLKPAPDIPKK